MLSSSIRIKGLYDTAMAILGKPQEHITADDLKGIAEQAGDYLKDTDADGNVPAQIYAFREEFEELLDAADIDQLVVLIDDLDRCLPDTVIATLEAIRLFLFVPRTAFVVAADEAMIEYAVRQHFPDLPLSTGPASYYARNYLEKLIQVPFRIPALGLAETRAYVTLLLVQSELGEKDVRFAQLLAAAREELRRPWESRGLDRTTIETVLGDVPPEIDHALQISVQITHILTVGRLSGTEAEQVFDTIRDRILQSDNLGTAPKGAAGLAALVRCQPALQRRLTCFSHSPSSSAHQGARSTRRSPGRLC